MLTPPLSSWVEVDFQKRRLGRISIFRGVLQGKRGGFFEVGGWGGGSVYIKNKLKFEISNDKKSLLTKMFFRLH